MYFCRSFRLRVSVFSQCIPVNNCSSNTDPIVPVTDGLVLYSGFVAITEEEIHIFTVHFFGVYEQPFLRSLYTDIMKILGITQYTDLHVCIT